MIEVIQGEQQFYSIDLVKSSNKRPVDLTGISEISVCFNTKDTVTTHTLGAAEIEIVGSPLLGQIQATPGLLIAETTAMIESDDGIVEVVLDYGGGNVQRIQIENSLSVKASKC